MVTPPPPTKPISLFPFRNHPPASPVRFSHVTGFQFDYKVGRLKGIQQQQKLKSLGLFGGSRSATTSAATHNRIRMQATFYRPSATTTTTMPLLDLTCRTTIPLTLSFVVVSANGVILIRTALSLDRASTSQAQA